MASVRPSLVAPGHPGFPPDSPIPRPGSRRTQRSGARPPPGSAMPLVRSGRPRRLSDSAGRGHPCAPTLASRRVRLPPGGPRNWRSPPRTGSRPARRSIPRLRANPPRRAWRSRPGSDPDSTPTAPPARPASATPPEHQSRRRRSAAPHPKVPDPRDYLPRQAGLLAGRSAQPKSINQKIFNQVL